MLIQKKKLLWKGRLFCWDGFMFRILLAQETAVIPGTRDRPCANSGTEGLIVLYYTASLCTRDNEYLRIGLQRIQHE